MVQFHLALLVAMRARSGPEPLSPWKSWLSPTGRRAQPPATAAAPERRRPAVLDHSPPLLAPLVRCPPDSQTRSCHRLAPRQLSSLLALALQSTRRSPQDFPGTAAVDRPHGRRK